MAVRVFCECGVDVTDEVAPLDRKTRTLAWFDAQPQLCAVCRRVRGLAVEHNEAGRKTIGIVPRRS